MAYKLGGWVEFTVEVRWIDDGDDAGRAKTEAFKARIATTPGVELVPTAMGTDALDDVMGRSELSFFVRVSCPANSVQRYMALLQDVCEATLGS